MGLSSEKFGPRLGFVTRKLPGTVKRFTARFDEKEGKLVRDMSDQAAGYMVFFPSGQAVRLTEDRARSEGFLNDPPIIGLEKASDNKTAVGRFKHAMSDAARQKAYREMEEEVIAVCKKRHGDIANLITDYNPKGKSEGVDAQAA